MKYMISMFGFVTPVVKNNCKLLLSFAILYRAQSGIQLADNDTLINDVPYDVLLVICCDSIA